MDKMQLDLVQNEGKRQQASDPLLVTYKSYITALCKLLGKLKSKLSATFAHCPWYLYFHSSVLSHNVTWNYQTQKYKYSNMYEIYSDNNVLTQASTYHLQYTLCSGAGKAEPDNHQ